MRNNNSRNTVHKIYASRTYFKLDISIRIEKLQDYGHNDKRCTILLLNNMTEPEWMSVNCSEKLLFHVFCMVDRNTDTLHSESTSKILNLKVNERTCVIVDNVCLDFTWISSHGQKIKTKCKLSLMKFHINEFMNLYDATASLFPPIFTYDIRYIVSYHRYSNIFHFRYEKIRKKITAFLASILHTPWRNVFFEYINHSLIRMSHDNVILVV